MGETTWEETVSLPATLVMAIAKMKRELQTGQILINFNEGVAQSFEMKEHHRL